MEPFRYLVLFSIMMVLCACQPSKEEAADVGLGNIREARLKVTSQNLEIPVGTHVAEVKALEKWIKLTVKHDDGLQLGDLVTFYNYTGSTVSLIITELYDSTLAASTSIANGATAYIPYEAGVLTWAEVVDDISGENTASVASIPSYWKLFIHGAEGISTGDELQFVGPTGDVVAYTVGTLYNVNLGSATTVAYSNYAYIPYYSFIDEGSQAYDQIQVIDLRQGLTSASITWTVTKQPLNGRLYGTAPNLVYTPSSSFVGYDRFYFIATDTITGEVSQGEIVLKMNPVTYTIYLAQGGNDGTAEEDDPSKPFLTAQGAVNKALALEPSASRRVVISVGPRTLGDFGNVTVYSDFGSYVSWVGADATSRIGNITGLGVGGANDVNGTAGPNLSLTADSNVTFQHISSTGGDGGNAITRTTAGGSAGSITVKARVQNVTSTAGFGVDLATGLCIGHAGGSIVIEEGATAVSVQSDGGGSCDTAGIGGTVVVKGIVGGNVTVNGGYNTSVTEGGKGGTVIVSGTVFGLIQAYGGDSTSGFGGLGGEVTVSGVVASTINVNGGLSTNSTGGNGGVVSILEGGYAAAITAFGGTGIDGGEGGSVAIRSGTVGSINASGGLSFVDTGGKGGYVSLNSGAVADSIAALGGQGVYGGDGGSVALIEATASDINVNGGSTSTLAGTAGNGGTVNLGLSSVAGALYAEGGACHTNDPGDGGTLSLNSTATGIYTDASVAGGTCSNSGAVGDEGVIKLVTGSRTEIIND